MRRLLFSLLRPEEPDDRCGSVPMNKAMLWENPVRLYGIKEEYVYKNNTARIAASCAAFRAVFVVY